MAAATDAGMLPRCTGMCSAWTSSSPAAVNTAAEQSARSLIFGERDDRRSTSPISVATPVSCEIKTCRAAGSIVNPRIRPSAPVALVRSHEPDGWASARQPGATQMVQSGSARTAGPATGPCRSGGGRARPGRPARPAGGGPDGHHLDGDFRQQEPVAPGVLGLEGGHRRHRELVALAGVAAVQADLHLGRPADGGRGLLAEGGGGRLGARRDRPDPARSAPGRPGGARPASRPPRARRPGAARPPPACRAPRPGRRRAAGRRRRTPPGPIRPDRRPAAPRPPARPAPWRGPPPR